MKTRVLCKQCGKCSPINDKTICEECLVKMTVRATKRRQGFKDTGLCQRCGKVPFATNKTMCRKCLDKYKEQSRKLATNRSNAGLCQICGEYPIRNASSICEICTLKVAAKNHLGSRKRYKELMTLFLKQNQRCPYTGMLLKIGTNTSLDHKIPKSKGGTNEIQNLQWVHIWVNKNKDNIDEEEFVPMFRSFIEQCHQYLNGGSLT